MPPSRQCGQIPRQDGIVWTQIFLGNEEQLEVVSLSLTPSFIPCSSSAATATCNTLQTTHRVASRSGQAKPCPRPFSREGTNLLLLQRGIPDAPLLLHRRHPVHLPSRTGRRSPLSPVMNFRCLIPARHRLTEVVESSVRPTFGARPAV